MEPIQEKIDRIMTKMNTRGTSRPTSEPIIHRYTVANSLPAHDVKDMAELAAIVNTIVSSPSGNDCGAHVPCRTAEAVLISLAEKHGVSEMVKVKLTHNLATIHNVNTSEAMDEEQKTNESDVMELVNESVVSRIENVHLQCTPERTANHSAVGAHAAVNIGRGHADSNKRHPGGPPLSRNDRVARKVLNEILQKILTELISNKDFQLFAIHEDIQTIQRKATLHKYTNREEFFNEIKSIRDRKLCAGREARRVTNMTYSTVDRLLVAVRDQVINLRVRIAHLESLIEGHEPSNTKRRRSDSASNLNFDSKMKSESKGFQGYAKRAQFNSGHSGVDLQGKTYCYYDHDAPDAAEEAALLVDIQYPAKVDYSDL
jgi:hypothetical protein